MFNQKDILAALQNGEDAQNIANAFADALNAAIKEKADADAKAKAAANRHNEKVNRMEDMLTDLLDFLQEFYPEIYDDELRHAINAEGLVQAMDEARDEVLKMQPVMDDLQKLLGQLEAAHPELKTGAVKVEKKPAADKSVDPIEAFLRGNGLKF